LRWDEGSKRAAIGDVLRVHDWNYVRKIQVRGLKHTMRSPANRSAVCWYE
jgi:hypothetical protein